VANRREAKFLSIFWAGVEFPFMAKLARFPSPGASLGSPSGSGDEVFPGLQKRETGGTRPTEESGGCFPGPKIGTWGTHFFVMDGRRRGGA